eukprot:4515328-Amphidinium_carterae.1
MRNVHLTFASCVLEAHDFRYMVVRARCIGAFGTDSLRKRATLDVHNPLDALRCFQTYDNEAGGGASGIPMGSALDAWTVP